MGASVSGFVAAGLVPAAVSWSVIISADASHPNSLAVRFGPRPMASFDCLRIDRRAGAAGDDQRRSAEEEFVDAVLGAVLRQILEIEDFAHAQPHGRNHHPVPGLVRFRGLVRPHLDAPGIRTDGGDLFVLAPIAILELNAGRVAAGVAAPFLLRQAALHLSGANNDEVAAADLDLLLLGASIELVV